MTNAVFTHMSMLVNKLYVFKRGVLHIKAHHLIM